MPLSDEFIDYVLDLFRYWGDVSARKMFGGAGLYSEGRMFGLIADDILYLKVDDSNRKEYLTAGSEPFRPFHDKPTTMSYYEVPPDLLEDGDQLMEWAKKSLAIQKRSKKTE